MRLIKDMNKFVFHTLKFNRFPVLPDGTKLMFGFLPKIYAIEAAASSFFI